MLSTDHDMAVKSHARGNFELFWSIFTKISACGSAILSLDCCVILYAYMVYLRLWAMHIRYILATYSYLDALIIGLKSFTSSNLAIYVVLQFSYK